jgi:hypothetical protein
MRLTATCFKSRFISLVAASACLFGVALAQPAAADALAPVSPPVAMPAFKLSGINGTSGSDADLRNKVTVIRFWASW